MKKVTDWAVETTIQKNLTRALLLGSNVENIAFALKSETVAVTSKQVTITELDSLKKDKFNFAFISYRTGQQVADAVNKCADIMKDGSLIAGPCTPAVKEALDATEFVYVIDNNVKDAKGNSIWMISIQGEQELQDEASV